jgi:hypothetical protein
VQPDRRGLSFSAKRVLLGREFEGQAPYALPEPAQLSRKKLPNSAPYDAISARGVRSFSEEITIPYPAKHLRISFSGSAQVSTFLHICTEQRLCFSEEITKSA